MNEQGSHSSDQSCVFSVNGFAFRGAEGQTQVGITAAKGRGAAQGSVATQPEFSAS